MIKRILVLLALLLCVCPAMATFNITFTSDDLVTANVSYIPAQGSATPLPIAAGVAILGIVLLVISIVYRPENGADILSILSVPPLLVSAIQFLSIDIVTGFGVTSQQICDPVIYESTRFVLMENHTIYQMYYVTTILIIFLVISVLNIYRVLMMEKLTAERREEE